MHKCFIRKAFRILLLIIILSVILFSFQSCKKGENDPFFSFRSRKARLVGEWHLSSGKAIFSGQNGNQSVTFDGSYGTTSEGHFTFMDKITIRKNGEFLRVTYNGDYINNQEGYWVFGSEIKKEGLKNKEYVELYVTKEVDRMVGYGINYVYEGTKCPMYRLKLDELRNDKMVIILDGKYDMTYNPGSPAKSTLYDYENSSEDGKMVYTKKKD